MLSLFVVDTRANPDASFSIGAVFVVTPSSVSAFGTGHRLTNVMSTGDAGCHKAAREVTSHHVMLITAVIFIVIAIVTVTNDHPCV